jgi:hypothetical protein
MNSKVFIPIDYLSFGLTKKAFFNTVHDSIDLPPNYESAKTCILSVESDLVKNVRKVIEKFVNHFDNIEIVDAGFFNSNKLGLFNSTVNDIVFKTCIPALIGFEEDTITTYIKENNFSVFCIANDLPYINDAEIEQKSYLSFQRHLCRLEDLQKLEETSFNSLSLGKLRSSAYLLEPCLRDAEIVIINLNAIRSSDAPNISDALPSGLNVEELCQILKFVGTSNQVKAIFFQLDSLSQSNIPEAGLIAESLWYFYEGLNMKINDHPSTNKDYSAFVVHLNDNDLDIEFVRNNQSFKWWLKMEKENKELEFLACSYEEYQQAIANELPERILKFIDSLD